MFLHKHSIDMSYQEANLLQVRYIVDQKFNNTKEPQLSWSITALSSDVIHKTTAVPNDIHIISRSQVVEQGFKVFMKYNNKSISNEVASHIH